MNISLDKIAPPVAFVIVGLIMIIIGAVGVIPIGNPQPIISEPITKIVLVVLGTLLVLVGPIFVWRELVVTKTTIAKTAAITGTQLPSDKSSEEVEHAPKNQKAIKYGIRIVSPVAGKKFKGGYGNLTVEVSGIYEVKPPPGTTLRLFVKTNEPLSYWRHPPVVNFDERGRKWYGKIDLWKDKSTHTYEVYIVVAILDELDEAMVQYASKVQRETNKNIPFDILPCHIEKSEDEVLVFRE